MVEVTVQTVMKMLKNNLKITIASGKGGTGKTTVSTNLTSYLANHEKKLF